jgi:hypothetical protein
LIQYTVPSSVVKVTAPGGWQLSVPSLTVSGQRDPYSALVMRVEGPDALGEVEDGPVEDGPVKDDGIEYRLDVLPSPLPLAPQPATAKPNTSSAKASLSRLTPADYGEDRRLDIASQRSDEVDAPPLRRAVLQGRARRARSLR